MKSAARIRASRLLPVVARLRPESGGRLASGVTDANGSFTLSTLAPGDGAVAGKHKVAFTKTQPPPAEGDYSVPSTPSDLPFNAKYANADTSGITAEIVAGKVNELPAWNLEK